MPWTAYVQPPPVGSVQKMKLMTINKQMELELAGNRKCASRHRTQRRQRRADWWFERMRTVVDRALDWRPTPPPRPEQTWLLE